MASDKGPLRPDSGFDRVREFEHLADLGRIKVGDVEEVPAQEGAH